MLGEVFQHLRPMGLYGLIERDPAVSFRFDR